MKIVNIGDLLVTPDMMRLAVKRFPRYDSAPGFFFGVTDRSQLRSYVREMERKGSRCAPLTQEILAELVDAEVVQTHLAPLPAQVFEVAKNLKLVLSNRGGTENIDLEAATAYRVPVLCNPAHNANAVAEMTLGMILAETRNISRCHAAMKDGGQWRETFPNSGHIRELRYCTVGLIGFGEIGRRVAALLRGFNSEILVFDPYLPAKVIAELGCRQVSLEELLHRSDIVSVHARAVKGAKPMIGRDELREMKPTSVLINTARASLVDMDALYIALHENWIMGAAIDVFDQEPVSEEHPLLALDNITLCCHKGGDTVEAYSESPEMLLDQAEIFFSGGRPRFLANPNVI